MTDERVIFAISRLETAERWLPLLVHLLAELRPGEVVRFPGRIRVARTSSYHILFTPGRDAHSFETALGVASYVLGVEPVQAELRMLQPTTCLN